MAVIDKEYNKILRKILSDGALYEDPNRKGVNRVEIPRQEFKYDLKNGFPVITSKKIAWKSVVAETLWILRGQTHIKHLHKDNVHIWDKDALNFGRFGELGRVYGYQLRNFGGEFDQLKWIINEMISNPLSTKKDVNYINPLDRSEQALTCCHTGWSILVNKKTMSFDLEFKMGSVDSFLGLPFNIASYALIAKILEKLTKLKANSLIGLLNNVHLYEDHINVAIEQLSRSEDKYSNKVELAEFGGFKMDMYQNVDTWLNSKEVSDFKLLNYESFPQIKAKMIPYIK